MNEQLKLPFDIFQLLQLLKLLQEDYDALNADLARSDKPYLRRALVRSAVTYFDSCTYFLKRFVIGLHELNKVKLTQDELTRLQKRDSFTNRVETTFTTFAKACGVAYVINRNTRGWDEFCKAIKIRNRLTHPQKIEDLELLDDDMKSVETGLNWYISQVNQIFEAWNNLQRV